MVKLPFSSALLGEIQDFTDERWRKPYASVMKREVKELQVLNMQELDHRIIESFELEGILKGHLVQLPCSDQGRLQLN